MLYVTDIWLWWNWYVFMSLHKGRMWKYHAMLPQTISVIGNLHKCNLTHQSNCPHMQEKKNPLSREVPMGFVLISLHPYDYIHHNWFWQNIHTGECQQNIVFLNFKYLQEYFAAKSMLVKELEMSFYQGRESLRKFKWMGMN